MIRKSPPPSGPGASSALTKRSRIEDDDDTNTLTVAIGSSGAGKADKGALIRTVKRTSGLEAPIVALTGAHGVRPTRPVSSARVLLADARARTPCLRARRDCGA